MIFIDTILIDTIGTINEVNIYRCEYLIKEIRFINFFSTTSHVLKRRPRVLVSV